MTQVSQLFSHLGTRIRPARNSVKITAAGSLLRDGERVRFGIERDRKRLPVLGREGGAIVRVRLDLAEQELEVVAVLVAQRLQCSDAAFVAGEIHDERIFGGARER